MWGLLELKFRCAGIKVVPWKFEFFFFFNKSLVSSCETKKTPRRTSSRWNSYIQLFVQRCEGTWQDWSDEYVNLRLMWVEDINVIESYVYWTVHHLDSWIKRGQLDVTCFIISLFNAGHVSDVNTSILRSLRLICWVISWVVLLWFDVCWCYVVIWLWWCGIRM